jgi:hypothetical protein
MPWHKPKLALSHYGTRYKTSGLLVVMLPCWYREAVTSTHTVIIIPYNTTIQYNAAIV